MSFPKVKRHHWRKAKTLAMLANRRQWQMEFNPLASSEVEIITEAGVYLITETSDTAVPIYYITE
jgi:hypothetical protein